MFSFRLVYRGRLPAASPDDKRNKDKERIRRMFHAQLHELWRTHPALRFDYVNRTHWKRDSKTIGAFQFLPFVAPNETCELRILFLRRDAPGNVVANGGDLDNRVKVLLDALRRPQQESEIVELPKRWA